MSRASSSLGAWVVRGPNWLGDLVMALPAVWNLKRGLGDSPLVVASPSQLADVWRACPWVDEVVELHEPRRLRATSRELGAARGRGILLLPNSLRSAVEARLAGFEEIAGYAGHARAWLLTTVVRPAPFVYERQHQQHFYRHLVSSAFGVPDESPKFPLLGSGRGVGAAKRLAVCPGAAYGPAKRWPAAYFAQVAAALRSQGGLEVVLLGAPGDREACAEVAAHLPNVVNKAGATSIAEFMDELRASSLVLCNDSGSMHLAAALGIPTAAIFGSTEPLRTGPLGPNAIALRHHVPCSPCFQRDCPLGDTRCLGNLQPADVIPACLGLMNS